jgi:hypothetical protein
MNSTIFWDVTPYILVEVYPRFGEAFFRQLQDRRIRQQNKKQTPSMALWLLLPDYTAHIPDSITLHGLIMLGWLAD